MAKVSIRRDPAQPLILPARQLNAALRKSADRAQRLADAFGKTVPFDPPLPDVKPTTAKRLKAASAAR